MCGLEAALSGAAAPPPAIGVAPLAPARGSRRRRVWELAEHAHCPVIGVCLPVQALRRLVDKRLGGEAVASDYELHCGVIAECRQRGPIAEAVQRELDRRYATAVRGAAVCKRPGALAAWWAAAPARGDVAGALWAVLTHARCDAALAEEVLRDMHMLQHQVGAATRADLRRLDELQRDHAELVRELARQRERSTEAAQAQARRLEQAQAVALQLRAELIGRDTRIGMLEERLRHLAAAVPGLDSRLALREDNQRQLERLQQLQRALQRAELELAQARRGEAPHSAPHMPPQGTPDARREAHPAEAIPETTREAPPADTARLRLARHAVLCVGGRRAKPLFPDFARARRFGRAQVFSQLGHGFFRQIVLAEFLHDAPQPVTRRAPVDQVFGKAFLGQPVAALKFVEHGIEFGRVFAIRAKLAP